MEKMDLQAKFRRDYFAKFDLPQPKYETVGTVKHYGANTCHKKIKNDMESISDPTYSIACSKDYYRQERQDILQSPEHMFIIYDERNRRIQNSLNNPIMRQMSIPPIDPDKLDKVLVNELIPEGTFYNARHLTCQILNPFRECQVLDCGDKAAEWIFKVFHNNNLRLGYFIRYVQQEEHFWKHFDLIYRTYNLQKNQINNYVKIMSVVSAKHLYQDMYEDAIQNQLYNLIIIDGNIEPFQEYRWNWIKIDDAIFKKRSLLPSSIDSSMSDDELKEMLWKWQYRNLITEWEMCSPGRIDVGQEVQVHTSTIDNNVPILDNIKRYCLAHSSK